MHPSVEKVPGPASSGPGPVGVGTKRNGGSPPTNLEWNTGFFGNKRHEIYFKMNCILWIYSKHIVHDMKIYLRYIYIYTLFIKICFTLKLYTYSTYLQHGFPSITIHSTSLCCNSRLVTCSMPEFCCKRWALEPFVCPAIPPPAIPGTGRSNQGSNPTRGPRGPFLNGRLKGWYILMLELFQDQLWKQFSWFLF